LSLLSAEQVTAKFDIPGVAKEDMNVTYHPIPARLEVSWKTVKIMEREIDEGMTVRDVEERTVCRTIPLPEGTRVSFLFSFFFFPCLRFVLS
jgi:HSP20 family molecular chaperone IbpA